MIKRDIATQDAGNFLIHHKTAMMDTDAIAVPFPKSATTNTELSSIITTIANNV